MQRHLVVLLFVSACAARPASVVAPLDVPPTQTAQPPAKSATPQEVSSRWEAYVEPVEIESDALIDAQVRELTLEYALIDKPFARPSGRRALLRLANMEVVELPDFVDPVTTKANKAKKTKTPFKSPRRPKAEPRVQIYGVGDHEALLAAFTGEETISFQVLSLETMRWELAGQFTLPKSRAQSQESRRKSRTWVYVNAGKVRLELSDEVRTTSRHVLDVEGLVWVPEASATEAGDSPCQMSHKLDDDVVRWGLAQDASDGAPAPSCIAVRATEADRWTRLDDPIDDELIIMRTPHRIDATRVLLTGGIQFKLFPFTRRADVVDLAKPEIRHIGRPQLGPKMEVPGERFLWAHPSEIVRFDPASETFTTEKAPELGFEHRWQVKLDDRTYLYGRADKDGAHFAKFGFRPIPE